MRKRTIRKVEKGNDKMSKELEALEKLAHMARMPYYGFDSKIHNKNNNLIKKYYETVKQAIKRNEPMKPKVAWKNEEDECIVGYRCLNCNGSLGAKFDDKPMFPNFCRHCGQKLDWSE